MGLISAAVLVGKGLDGLSLGSDCWSRNAVVVGVDDARGRGKVDGSIIEDGRLETGNESLSERREGNSDGSREFSSEGADSSRFEESKRGAIRYTRLPLC